MGNTTKQMLEKNHSGGIPSNRERAIENRDKFLAKRKGTYKLVQIGPGTWKEIRTDKPKEVPDEIY